MVWNAEKGSILHIGQKKSKSECANAHSDLKLFCPFSVAINVVAYTDKHAWHA